MSSRGSFSLGKALSAAVASLPAAWAGAWLALILLWGAVVGGHLLMMHLYKAPLAGLIALSIVVATCLLKLMAQGALYRTAVFGKGAAAEGRGLGGLQLGKPEWRLLGASLLVVLFMLLIAGATVIVLAVAFNLSGLGEGYANSAAALHAAFVRHGSPADWAFIVLIPASLLFLLFVAIKFVLFAAATVAEKRMVTLNALGLSSGNVGKLFIGLVLLAVPFVAAGFLMLHLTIGQRISAHLVPQAGSTYRVHLWLHGIMMGLSIGGLLPLQAGFLTSAYRQIVALRVK